MFVNDFVLNGVGHGPVGQVMNEVHWQPGMLRPWVCDRTGRLMVTINHAAKRRWNDKSKQYDIPTIDIPVRALQDRGMNNPVWNTTSGLRKADWIRFDEAAIKEARDKLVLWGDIAAANSVGGFNGMMFSTYEWEVQSDPLEAVVGMSPVMQLRDDTPQYGLDSVPLPITQVGFTIDQRMLAQSRAKGMPLDTNLSEAAGARIGETVEDTAIGNITGVTFGSQDVGGANYWSHRRASTVFGFKTYTPRNTKNDLTVPTGLNPDDTLTDVLAMRTIAKGDRHYGPYMLYHSADFDTFMDGDYFINNTGIGAANGTTLTLRNRLRQIEEIQDCKRLDRLTASTPSGTQYALYLAQLSGPTCPRAIIGMDITTVNWPTHGGAQENFRVMCIYALQMRSDFDDRTGLVDATTA